MVERNHFTPRGGRLVPRLLARTSPLTAHRTAHRDDPAHVKNVECLGFFDRSETRHKKRGQATLLSA